MDENQMIEVEEVDVEEIAKRGEEVPRARRYIIWVDKQRVAVESPRISGAEILSRVGKIADTHKLYQHIRGKQPVLVAPDDIVDLTMPGVERFTTMPKDTTEGLSGALEVRRHFSLPQSDEEYLNGLGLPLVNWSA